MIMTLLLILVAIAFISMIVGIAKDNYTWRATADASNIAIMLILLVINIVQGHPIWCFICAIFLVLDFISFTINAGRVGEELKKKDKKVNNVENTKSVLKEFIKEIEEYGSTRH